jgi:hypothetical protein
MANPSGAMAPGRSSCRYASPQVISGGDNRWDISCHPVYSEHAHPKSRHLPGDQQGEPSMYEAPAIIGSCINCIAPGSLGATLALILIGAGVALTAERRKLIRARR